MMIGVKTPMFRDNLHYPTGLNLSWYVFIILLFYSNITTINARMFYYLLYNSSFSFIVDNRLFTTVLYGSILYILTHAILNYCHVEILEIINNYFWFIFILDIISLAYGVYQNITNLESNSAANSAANLDVSFNLLKNQINTISTYFNKKNDISITDNTPIPTPRQPLRIPTSSPHSLSAPQSATANSSSAYGTNPSIQQQNKKSQSTGFSTPITALRDLELNSPSRNTHTSQIPEPIITSNEGSFGLNEYSDGPSESVAGSDVGSIMDLDDFENSL
jgi:hypothetical protein